MSPELFAAAYGGKWAYDLIDEADFEKAWQRFTQGPYRAVNVTMPFKERAARAADIKSPEVEKLGAANILVKTDAGIKAYNSDYLGLRELLSEPAFKDCGSVAVAGYGGAGKAALAAARDCGFDTSLYRHDGLENGVRADIIIYTLPRSVPGIEKLQCRHLLEANYKDPCLQNHPGYISGKVWLERQATAGYPLMTGEIPGNIHIFAEH